MYCGSIVIEQVIIPEHEIVETGEGDSKLSAEEKACLMTLQVLQRKGEIPKLPTKQLHRNSRVKANTKILSPVVADTTAATPTSTGLPADKAVVNNNNNKVIHIITI